MPDSPPPPVAVVTGSSSGIGRATALRFGQAGYAVVLHARQNLKGLMETARLLLADSPTGQVCAITGDLEQAGTCLELVRCAFAWHGHVDAWVNNAGADILTGAAASEPFDQQLQRLLAVDVVSTIRMSRLVAQRMCAASPASRGSLPCIINLGWDQAGSGMEGKPGQLFGTTKAAVEAFTRSLALTVAPHIRVNCVAPGWIKTAWGDGAPDHWDRRAQDESLLRRWGTPDDVAQAIFWLASREAEFINGHTLPVNGGHSAHRYLSKP